MTRDEQPATSSQRLDRAARNVREARRLYDGAIPPKGEPVTDAAAMRQVMRLRGVVDKLLGALDDVVSELNSRGTE